MGEMTKDDPVGAARERVHATLQVLWEKAGTRSAYVKSEWLELEASIDVLPAVAAADATDWMRTAITEVLEELPELLCDLAEVARTVSLSAEADKAEGKARQAVRLLERVRLGG